MTFIPDTNRPPKLLPGVENLCCPSCRGQILMIYTSGGYGVDPAWRTEMNPVDSEDPTGVRWNHYKCPAKAGYNYAVPIIEDFFSICK